MSERNWNSEYTTNQYQDPWDQGTYQTGSTRPPKSHGGCIAVLLAAVILLGGIASALGLLNIKLLQGFEDPQADEQDTVSFSATRGTTPLETASQDESLADPKLSVASDGGGLDLEQSPPSVENIPQAGGLSLQEIYEKNINAVVSIICSSGQGSSTGTGVVLSQDGYIVTNCHVVEGAETIQVLFTDERLLDAALVGTDAISDLAVLHVAANDLIPAQFGDSSALRVGDTVVAIGDPLGVELRGSMTDGIVSAINRDITTGGRTMTLIQTNAALNSGNSGGPLINCYGQVVGINTMKIGDYMSSAGVEGLGFAIPSTTVKEIVDQLMEQGYVSGRPSLGITGEDVSTFYQLYYRLPSGVYITGVDSGSSAAQVGIQPRDILLSLDGQRVSGVEEFTEALYAYQVGDVVEAVIYRGGRQYTVELTVSEANS